MINLSALLSVHPRSLSASLGRGRQVFPYLNLIWLFWLLAAPWLLPLGPVQLAFTYGSLLLFLPLYFTAWFGERARLVPCTVAIAALGLISLPINTCWSYLV